MRASHWYEHNIRVQEKKLINLKKVSIGKEVKLCLDITLFTETTHWLWSRPVPILTAYVNTLLVFLAARTRLTWKRKPFSNVKSLPVKAGGNK